MSVHMCECGYIYEQVCVHVCTLVCGGQRLFLMLDAFFYHSLFLRVTEPGQTNFIRVISQRAPGILFFLPPQH